MKLCFVVGPIGERKRLTVVLHISQASFSPPLTQRPRVCAVAQDKKSSWDEPFRPPLLPAAFFDMYSLQSAAVTNVRSHTGPASRSYSAVTWQRQLRHIVQPLSPSLLLSRLKREKGPPSLSTEWATMCENKRKREREKDREHTAPMMDHHFFFHFLSAFSRLLLFFEFLFIVIHMRK